MLCNNVKISHFTIILVKVLVAGYEIMAVLFTRVRRILNAHENRKVWADIISSYLSFTGMFPHYLKAARQYAQILEFLK